MKDRTITVGTSMLEVCCDVLCCRGVLCCAVRLLGCSQTSPASHVEHAGSRKSTQVCHQRSRSDHSTGMACGMQKAVGLAFLLAHRISQLPMERDTVAGAV
jgi:hypothetical protein